MTPDDATKFFSVLTGAAEVLRMGEISAVAQRTWFEALKDYPIEDVTKAFSAEVKNPDRKSFFIQPADIIRQIEGTSQEKALAAWNVVRKCNCDAYDTVIFEDPIIHQVIEDMGGWITFNDPAKWGRYTNADGKQYGYTDQQFTFFQKEFLDRYTSLVKSGVTNPPPKLIGIIEADNRTNFPEHVPEPIRITHDGRKLLPENKPVMMLPEPELPEKESEPADPERVEAMIDEIKAKLSVKGNKK